MPAAAPEDRLQATLEALVTTVDALKVTVTEQGKRLNLLYSLALVVVGAVGGPNAVALLTGH